VKYPDWFQDLVEEWRRRLIPEWRIVLMPEPLAGDSEGKSGQAQPNPVYRRLNVWVDMDPANRQTGGDHRRDIEETLVHEILHGALDPVIDAYRPALEHMGFLERKLINRTAECAEEHLIEWLARLLIAFKYDGGDVGHLRIAEGKAES
jgi:hypothetical protein